MSDTIPPVAASRIWELEESLATLEQLHREDRGWDLMAGSIGEDVMSADGRRRTSDMCEMMTIANPLIRRGFMLRHSYVWGGGHQISVDTGEKDTAGAVNAVVQAMLDDPRNEASLRSEEAITLLERWVYTHGAVALLCDTDTDPGAGTGAVVVRQVDPDQLTDNITDPEDAKTVRYWRREYSTRNILKDGTAGAVKKVTVWHPDIDYHPTGQDRLDTIGGKPVRWDQPLLVRCVNTPATAGWSWGIPDAYAAVAWARMSKEFLESWAVLMKALSRYAWRTSTRGKNVNRAAAVARTAEAQTPANPTGAGAHAVMDTDTTLEAVPKTGATIDATSGQPLQQMVAAALDVPVTMLLGDPGSTGARAVAETLDQPLQLAMGARRRFWAGMLGRLCQHAIDAAILAPRGPLQGTVVATDGRHTVTLPEGWSRTVKVDWPTFSDLPVDVLMKAIRDADGLDKLPAELVVRLALKALGVEDLDEWLEKMRAEGAFAPPVPEGERVAP